MALVMVLKGLLEVPLPSEPADASTYRVVPGAGGL